MSNPVFDALGGGNALPGNMAQIIAQFNQFKQTFSGDPRAQVQALLNSGKVSQAQYNRAVMMAQQLQRLMK